MGVGIAGSIIAAGLGFIYAAVVRLELLETIQAETFLAMGLSFVLLGVIAITAYGVVRAIERLSR
jgi:hypothetical protein